jgi:hypothetical protein
MAVNRLCQSIGAKSVYRVFAASMVDTVTCGTGEDNVARKRYVSDRHRVRLRIEFASGAALRMYCAFLCEDVAEDRLIQHGGMAASIRARDQRSV